MKNILKLTVLAALTLLSITSCKKEELNTYKGIEYTGDLFKVELIGDDISDIQPLLRYTNQWVLKTNGMILEKNATNVIIALDKGYYINMTTLNRGSGAENFIITNLNTNEVTKVPATISDNFINE